MKEAADVLAESREYLESHGWCRGEMMDPQGHVCAMGAVCFSQSWENRLLGPDELPVYREVMQALLEAIRTNVGFSVTGNGIPFWNDACAKDQQEVVDMFMAAEKLARSGSLEVQS